MYSLHSGKRIWSYHIDGKPWGGPIAGRPIALSRERLYFLHRGPLLNGGRSCFIEAYSQSSRDFIYRNFLSPPLPSGMPAPDNYKLIYVGDKSEYLICFPNSYRPTWSGFTIIDGATGVTIQQVKDSIIWGAVAMRQGMDGFLMWSEVALQVRGSNCMIQQTMLRQSDGKFNPTNVSLISHPGGNFHADMSTGYGLAADSSGKMKIFSISRVPDSECLPLPSKFGDISIDQQYHLQLSKYMTRPSPRSKRRIFFKIEGQLGTGKPELLDTGRWIYRGRERSYIIDFGRYMKFVSGKPIWGQKRLEEESKSLRNTKRMKKTVM
jgi:hypothetical protein